MPDVTLWLPQGDRIVNFRSGEIIDLPVAPMGQLGEARFSMVRAREVIQIGSRMIDTEIAKRLDRENRRSITVMEGDSAWELTVNAPYSTEWDVTHLQETLDQLVNEGRLGGGVPGRALVPHVTYKPNARELQKLLTHDDARVRELISECKSEVPSRRRVTVNEGDPALSHGKAVYSQESVNQ